MDTSDDHRSTVTCTRKEISFYGFFSCADIEPAFDVSWFRCPPVIVGTLLSLDDGTIGPMRL
jgi:hypothetical protein